MQCSLYDHLMDQTYAISSANYSNAIEMRNHQTLNGNVHSIISDSLPGVYHGLAAAAAKMINHRRRFCGLSKRQIRLLQVCTVVQLIAALITVVASLACLQSRCWGDFLRMGLWTGAIYGLSTSVTFLTWRQRSLSQCFVGSAAVLGFNTLLLAAIEIGMHLVGIVGEVELQHSLEFTYKSTDETPQPIIETLLRSRHQLSRHHILVHFTSIVAATVLFVSTLIQCLRLAQRFTALSDACMIEQYRHNGFVTSKSQQKRFTLLFTNPSINRDDGSLEDVQDTGLATDASEVSPKNPWKDCVEGVSENSEVIPLEMYAGGSNDVDHSRIVINPSICNSPNFGLDSPNMATNPSLKKNVGFTSTSSSLPRRQFGITPFSSATGLTIQSPSYTRHIPRPHTTKRYLEGIMKAESNSTVPEQLFYSNSNSIDALTSPTNQIGLQSRRQTRSHHNYGSPKDYYSASISPGNNSPRLWSVTPPRRHIPNNRKQLTKRNNSLLFYDHEL